MGSGWVAEAEAWSPAGSPRPRHIRPRQGVRMPTRAPGLAAAACCTARSWPPARGGQVERRGPPPRTGPPREREASPQVVLRPQVPVRAVLAQEAAVVAVAQGDVARQRQAMPVEAGSQA